MNDEGEGKVALYAHVGAGLTITAIRMCLVLVPMCGVPGSEAKYLVLERGLSIAIHRAVIMLAVYFASSYDLVLSLVVNGIKRLV